MSVQINLLWTLFRTYVHFHVDFFKNYQRNIWKLVLICANVLSFLLGLKKCQKAFENVKLCLIVWFNSFSTVWMMAIFMCLSLHATFFPSENATFEFRYNGLGLFDHDNFAFRFSGFPCSRYLGCRGYNSWVKRDKCDAFILVFWGNMSSKIICSFKVT